jgi:hypothetical protein
MKEIILKNVTEYAEEFDVKLVRRDEKYGGQLVLNATNEGGYNGVDIDFIQLLTWIGNNKALIKSLLLEEQQRTV